MDSKKTIRIPLAAEGVPIAITAWEKREEVPPVPGPQGAPQVEVTDEVTVPVRSSIESSLTFELLRRQSTDDEEDGEPKP